MNSRIVHELILSKLATCTHTYKMTWGQDSCECLIYMCDNQLPSDVIYTHIYIVYTHTYMCMYIHMYIDKTITCIYKHNYHRRWIIIWCTSSKTTQQCTNTPSWNDQLYHPNITNHTIQTSPNPISETTNLIVYISLTLSPKFHELDDLIITNTIV